MGIQISSANSVPAVTYDKIHVTKLEIVQPIFNVDGAHPIYQVLISYRHYGVVEGIRYYMSEEVQRIAIDDFITMAATDAANGNMTLVDALNSIEAAIAAIIGDQTGVSTTIV